MTNPIYKNLVPLLTMAVFMGGCASTSDSLRGDWKNCALLGGAVGGGAGAIGDTEHEAASMAAGALLGGVICALMGPGDADGDGVMDDKDQCPDTPKGTKVDSTGCPIVPDRVESMPVDVDSDGDGVVDRLDQCPGTPRGIQVDSRGCPKEQTFSLQGVNFEFDSAVLTSEAKTTLNAVAAQLKGSPQLKVEVAGHTCDLGSDQYNLSLSQRRAESVVQYLSGMGVARGSLTAKGYGEAKPVADNQAPGGREQNRRVEFTLSK